MNLVTTVAVPRACQNKLSGAASHSYSWRTADQGRSGVLVAVGCGQRGAMDPGCEVGGRAFGDSGGISGKFLVAEELTPLSGRSLAEELVTVVVEAVVAGFGREFAGPALHVLEGGGLDQVRPYHLRYDDPEPVGYVAHLPFEVIEEVFIAQQHDVRLVAYLPEGVQMVEHDLQVGNRPSGHDRIDPGPEA